MFFLNEFMNYSVHADLNPEGPLLNDYNHFISNYSH